MYKFFIVLSLIFFPSLAYGDMFAETSYDLGVLIAPSFAPEVGYEKSKMRFGVEFGVSFIKYEDNSWMKLKKISSPPDTIFKLLRVGVAAIVNRPVLIFSPISVMIKNRVYLSPSLGMGKDPYTLFSFSYELLP